MRTASVFANTLAAGDAFFQRLRHGARLLVDLLQHVVRVVALLGGVGREFAGVHLAAHGVAVVVGDAIAVAADFAGVAFLEEHEIARHRQQCRDVGGDEVLALAQADDHRAALAREDHAPGLVFGDHHQRIRAFQFRDRGAHGLEQVIGLLQVIVHAMRDHLGVGLRGERIPRRLQLGAQLVVVLDDAVVDDRDAVPRDVRVRVALARHAVGRPAGVGDAQLAVRGALVQRVLENPHLADGAQALDRAAAVQYRHARGVIAAVLEAAQALDQDGHDVALGDGSDDSAHARSFYRGAARLTVFH
jgi:hypothetical protein